MAPQVGQVVLGAYALLLGVGGVLGFVRARSLPSLIAGLLSAVAAGVAVAVSFREPRTGFGLGWALALGLAVLFGSRLARTRKFMPAGLVGLASVVVLVVLSVLLAAPAA